MKNRIFFQVFFFFIFMLVMSNCFGENNLKFLITIYYGKEVVLTSVFSCKDLNKDGIIDLNELVTFKEVEVYNVSESMMNTGWRSFVDVDKMPMLDHSLEDIQAFRFNISEFKKGNIILEYNTVTKRDFKFESYYFWRIFEIKSNGKEIGFFHGVGDGTQGLTLSMLSPEGLTMKIKAQ